MTPLDVKPKGLDYIVTVPCGKCPECIARRQSAWSFRLMEEEKVSINSFFVTLTYDTDYVPLSAKGFMTLKARDVTLFFKRFRKENDKAGFHNLKYYLVGEYGSQTMRPHYHALLFNCKLTLVQDAWNMGGVHYGTVTGASVGYCLKYMSKLQKVPVHQNDDRVPEFARMSKGLGKMYMSERMCEWHYADLKNRCFVNLKDGKKCTMPRYYKDKLYTKAEKELISQTQLARLVEANREAVANYPGDWVRDRDIGIQREFDKLKELHSKRGKI